MAALTVVFLGDSNVWFLTNRTEITCIYFYFLFIYLSIGERGAGSILSVGPIMLQHFSSPLTGFGGKKLSWSFSSVTGHAVLRRVGTFPAVNSSFPSHLMTLTFLVCKRVQPNAIVKRGVTVYSLPAVMGYLDSRVLGSFALVNASYFWRLRHQLTRCIVLWNYLCLIGKLCYLNISPDHCLSISFESPLQKKLAGATLQRS